jgi:glycosyltransferase involved in cell wall biosynthesis
LWGYFVKMDFTKPRVAIYYYVMHRNDGAPLFASYNLRKILDGNTEMNKSDGNVVHLWPTNGPEDFGKFDLHLWVDHGEDALGVPLTWYPPSPNAYWVSDAHLGYKYRMETAKKFDHVFVAQKEFVEQFVADGVDREKIHYLPHAFEPDCYKPHEIIKKWDWSFIGHLNSPHRIELLDRLCKEFPNWYMGWRTGADPKFNVLEDVANKLSQSRVGVNYSIKKDLNMRLFETLGTRTCLLTDNIEPIHEFFEDGKDLVTFNSIDDAVAKMNMLLKNPDVVERIAESGYRKALAGHTYYHRVEEILKVCLNYKPQGELITC